MASAYAQCTDCGHEFESNFYKPGAGTRGVRLVGITETCPQCGGMARTMEGRFDYVGDDVRMTAGPEWTRDMLDRVRERLATIQHVADSTTYTDDEARERVEELLSEIAEINPVVAQEYRKRARPDKRITWKAAATAVAGAIAVIGALNTVADFADRVGQLWEFFSAQAGPAVVQVHDPQPDGGWRLPEQDA